jgi:hypothetical protein
MKLWLALAVAILAFIFTLLLDACRDAYPRFACFVTSVPFVAVTLMLLVALEPDAPPRIAIMLRQCFKYALATLVFLGVWLLALPCGCAAFALAAIAWGAAAAAAST